MSDLFPSDLRDPEPPVPGERERDLVAARAQQLGRRRHLLQGGGALALVAAVAVSVAALTAGGASGPGGTGRVQAASSDTHTTVSTPISHVTTTPAPTTVAPAPTTAAPAPTGQNEPAPQANTEQAVPSTEAPVAPVQQVVPSTFTLSGTVTGNPAGTTITLTLDESISVPVDAGGHFSVSGLAPGEYSIIGFWTDTATGTASQASRLGSVDLTADSSVSLAFTN